MLKHGCSTDLGATAHREKTRLVRDFTTKMAQAGIAAEDNIYARAVRVSEADQKRAYHEAVRALRTLGHRVHARLTGLHGWQLARTWRLQRAALSSKTAPTDQGDDLYAETLDALGEDLEAEMQRAGTMAVAQRAAAEEGGTTGPSGLAPVASGAGSSAASPAAAPGTPSQQRPRIRAQVLRIEREVRACAMGRRWTRSKG
jgi:hypothetical protein